MSKIISSEKKYHIGYEDYNEDTFFISSYPIGGGQVEVSICHGDYSFSDIEVAEKVLAEFNLAIDNNGSYIDEKDDYIFLNQIDINNIKSTFIVEEIITTTKEYFKFEH